MPAWNEEEGIAGFIRELNDSLAEWSAHFIVVNDCSTDSTAEQVESLAASGVPVTVITNDQNSGHGVSTVRALSLGLNSGADVVVAVDSDGQFIGEDVAHVVRELLASNVQVVEGVRVSRHDPPYRVAVTFATRALVWSRSNSWPRDANTPLRAYRPATLKVLLDAVPPQAATPNLFISAICRRRRIPFLEIQVTSIPRRGAEAVGTTWGTTRTLVPSRRFLSFCTNAAAEWVRTPIATQRKTGKVS